MRKLSAFSVLLMFFFLAPLTATALPLTWTLTSPTFSGSFTFDALTGVYSNVVFQETHFFDSYNSATGDATGFVAVSSGVGDQTTVNFENPLTDLGGITAFTASTQCFDLCLNSPNPFSFTGVASSQAQADLPVPASAALFSLGFIALAWRCRMR